MPKRSAVLPFLAPVAFAAAVCLCVVAFCGSARAEEGIRYKPVVVQTGDNNLYPPKVLIVDTKDGHVWLWQERGRKDSAEGAPDAQIIYQGRLAPGRAAGEAVATVKGRK